MREEVWRRGERESRRFCDRDGLALAVVAEEVDEEYPSGEAPKGEECCGLKDMTG